MAERLNVALLGCGMRARAVVSIFLKELGEKFHISSLYDPSSESLKLAQEKWRMPALTSCATMEEAVNHPEADLVMIFSPNAFHCEGILAALKAKKQVFSEKPLATTLEDCEKILQAEKDAGISIMTGFVLRYSPFYRKIKELLDSGTFGRIINISANENRPSQGGGHSMCADYGWRRLRKFSGPYLLEKCSHDLDLLNWYANSTPQRVASFSSLDYFTPQNQYIWEKYSHKNFDEIVIPGHCIDPFLSEKDIYDNHTVIMEYPNGIKMNFQLTLANAISERRMYISCTEGTIIAEAESGTIRYKHYDELCETCLKFTGGGHSGGDEVMVREIADAVLNNKELAVSGSVNGLACARVALAADKSVETGKIIRMDEFC